MRRNLALFIGTLLFSVLMTGMVYGYEIGDRCPAGGIIFYDKGNDNDDWRYLSAAPASSEFSARWSRRYLDVAGTCVEIGTGKANTELLVSFLTLHGESNTAAHLCKELEIGGHTDWFLPSKGELHLMFTILKQRNLDTFKGEGYWSSSQMLEEKAWLLLFLNGRQYGFDKDTTENVRAIRAF